MYWTTMTTRTWVLLQRVREPVRRLYNPRRNHQLPCYQLRRRLPLRTSHRRQLLCRVVLLPHLSRLLLPHLLLPRLRLCLPLPHLPFLVVHKRPRLPQVLLRVLQLLHLHLHLRLRLPLLQCLLLRVLPSLPLLLRALPLLSLHRRLPQHQCLHPHLPYLHRHLLRLHPRRLSSLPSHLHHHPLNLLEYLTTQLRRG